MNNLLITICARSGSKGVKNKNIRELAGKPLIYYTINQAKKWGRAQRIVVSTDSEEISEIAKSFGAEVPFLRPADLASDTSAKIPAISHALLSSEDIYKEKYNLVMDLDVTSPVRTVQDLENSYNLFLEKNPKTLFSVVTAHKNPYFNMVEINTEGKAVVCKPGKNFIRRQETPKVYDVNASIYIYDRDFLVDKNNINVISDDSIVYVMGDVSRIDIDSELDFKFIEFLVKDGIISL